MDEPRPLSDDDRDPLARLVRHGRGLEVAYDVEAGLARHIAAIDGGAQPWSMTSGGSGWGLGLGLGVIAIAAVVAGWIAMRSPEATPVATAATDDVAVIDAAPVPQTRAVASAAIVPTSTAAGAVAVDEVAPPSGSLPAVPARGLPPRARPVAPRVAASAPTPVSTPEQDSAPSTDDRIAREAAQIRQIRHDLAEGRAAAAMRSCDAGDDEFGDGVFALERQGLRVLSLFALGRRDEAMSAATRYLDAHPKGPLAAKIRAAAAD